MSCRYYLFPINNIYASVLYACYLFSRQIIYLFFSRSFIKKSLINDILIFVEI